MNFTILIDYIAKGVKMLVDFELTTTNAIIKMWFNYMMKASRVSGIP
jgi:hypothetical protein